MDTIVRDEAVQQDKGQASVARSSPEPACETRAIDEIARRISDDHPDDRHIVSPSRFMSRRRSDISRTMRLLLRKLATAGIAIVAVMSGLVTWDMYNTAPWTRDGRVRVQVASVAPQVSGQITELRVVDNQFVHKGDILYVIEASDFEVALRAKQGDATAKDG